MPIPSFGKRRKAVEGLSTARSKTLDACSCLVHRLVVNRDSKFTNFVEFRTHKVIYRRYAGLFFSLCVDITDNELAYLECIYLFVEILDNFFSNVCELNLVFNFHKVYLILDEFILAGELQETSKRCA
ncbi:unnamed protein product [Brassica oleracea var. botrytis]